jgi:hypothetical protein
VTSPDQGLSSKRGKSLGTRLPKSLPFILTLWPDSLESSWGDGQYPGQSGQKAVEKAVGATFSIGSKGLFYGLVAKFSRILLVEKLDGKYPSQSPIGTQGLEKSRKGTS